MDILSDQEMLRYNRQIILRQFDFEGQEALKQSSVLILGAGGLGCASSQYLATLVLAILRLSMTILLNSPIYNAKYCTTTPILAVKRLTPRRCVAGT